MWINIMQELRFSNWPASPLLLAEFHAHRTCGSTEYMPSSAFRFSSMLLSTFAFRLRVSSCPRGLHSLPLPSLTEISYAPTRRTLVIQRLARFQLDFKRLRARRTLSSEMGEEMIPCSKLTWAANSKVHSPRSFPKSRGLRCSRSLRRTSPPSEKLVWVGWGREALC